MLNIGGLHQGVVIDHIQAGAAMKIYEYLNLDEIDACVFDKPFPELKTKCQIFV